MAHDMSDVLALQTVLFIIFCVFVAMILPTVAFLYTLQKTLARCDPTARTMRIGNGSTRSTDRVVPPGSTAPARSAHSRPAGRRSTNRRRAAPTAASRSIVMARVCPATP